MSRESRYTSLKEAAVKALVEIAPTVPTWSISPTSDSIIIPPPDLEGFRKLDLGNRVRLDHMTPVGKKPYTRTMVDRRGGNLEVTETVSRKNGVKHTSISFSETGVVASTTIDRTRTKHPSGRTCRRIVRTLSPSSPNIIVNTEGLLDLLK